MQAAFQDTLGMFLFLAVELSALFLAVSFLVSLLRRRLPAGLIERWLGDDRPRSYLLAAAIGALTPFCSCSTIPMLKGLIRARAGFGPMMAFLLTSPLLNPIVVVLLAATFGLRLTAIYFAAALLVSLAAGWLLRRLGFQREIRAGADAAPTGCSGATDCGSAPPATNPGSTVGAMAAGPTGGEAGGSQDAACNAQPGAAAESAATGCCGGTTAPASGPGLSGSAWRDARADFRAVLPYLLLGVAIGSLIYGFVPDDLLARHAGADSPWSVPVAAVIGVPLYLRAEALIPIAAALMDKGVAGGTVLALIIGGAGASLTELILLRALFSYRLLAAFLLVIFAMATAAGLFTLALFPA